MKNSLEKEIHSTYKDYSARSKSYSIVNQIKLSTVLFTILKAAFIYAFLYLFSKNFYFHFPYVDNSYDKGLILLDLPSIIINIEIGLFSIFFSLVILITSYIYESKNSDSSYILIKSSRIFQLIIYNLCILISFLFNEKLWDSYLQIIPLVINIALIVISFFNTLKILSNNEYFKKEKKSVLLNKIKINNKHLIKERLAKNYDLSVLNGKDYSIRYSFITDKGVNIKSLSKGIVTDIKLIDLKKCIKKIEAKIPKSIDDAKDNVETTSLGNINITPINVNLHCSIGDLLSEGRSLLHIDCNENVWDKIKIENFQKEINECYLVRDIKHPNNNLKNIFLGIEDDLIFSIINKNRKSIDENIENLIEIIESFEDLLVFDFENAGKENNIGGGWSCINYVIDIIRHSIEEAVLLSDLDILSRTIKLPYSLVIGAIRKNDHYVFNEFLIVFPFLYHLGNKYKDSNLKSYLISQSIKLPAEISNLYFSQIVKSASDEEMNSVFNFSTQLLRKQQDILKMMIDENESEIQFAEGLKRLNKMFDSLYFQIHDSLDQVFYFMTNPKYRDQIYRIDVYGKKYSEIQIRKFVITFMLGNYILKKEKSQYMDSILNILPTDIDYITYIYQLSNDFSLENSFGWSWWGIDDFDDMEVHTLDSDTSDFYLYFLFKRVSVFNYSKEDFAFNENLIYKIKEHDGIVQKKLNKINTNHYSEEEVEKKGQIKSYFNKISELYNQIKSNSIAISKLDSHKIEEAKKEIIEGYNSHFGLIDLFKDPSFTDNISEEKINGGYNQLLNKEPYIFEGHGVVGIKQFGIGVKDFESQSIFQNWFRNGEILSVDEWNANDKKETSPIVISTFLNINHLREKLEDSYKNRWQIESDYDFTNTIGYYSTRDKTIPIISLGYQKESTFTNKAFLIDPSNIGSVEIEKNGDSKLKLEFIDLNEDTELRAKIISDSPAYLDDIDDKELYLRGKVVFKLLTTFRVIPNKIKLYEI